MAAMQLTRTHRILIGVIITGAAVIAAIGFVGSYAAVRDLAQDKGFGSFANVFPIGIDAGIVVLLALDLLLTWIRIPFPLLRQTAWLLTAATIAFNGAAAWPDPLGVGMHAVIPVLFVVAVEAARHAIGRIADITADRHMESVRVARWLLAPVPTFRLWRRMKLWELRSYDEVIRLEQDRLVYRARLRARFGRAWRRKAPVESLMPLRLARYGVPISQTAPAGLAAAGIVVPPERALASAETTGTAEPVGAIAGTAGGAAPKGLTAGGPGPAALEAAANATGAERKTLTGGPGTGKAGDAGTGKAPAGDAGAAQTTAGPAGAAADAGQPDPGQSDRGQSDRGRPGADREAPAPHGASAPSPASASAPATPPGPEAVEQGPAAHTAEGSPAHTAGDSPGHVAEGSPASARAAANGAPAGPAAADRTPAARQPAAPAGQPTATGQAAGEHPAGPNSEAAPESQRAADPAGAPEGAQVTVPVGSGGRRRALGNAQYADHPQAAAGGYPEATAGGYADQQQYAPEPRTTTSATADELRAAQRAADERRADAMRERRGDSGHDRRGGAVAERRAEAADGRGPEAVSGQHTERPPAVTPEYPPDATQEIALSALPDDVPRDEAFYGAFRQFVAERGAFPDSRQFSRYLLDLYGIAGVGGGPLPAHGLRREIRELRERYRMEMETQHIP